MAIVADLSGHSPTDKKLSSPNRANVGSPYGVLFPRYSGELVLDAANGQLFVGGDPDLNTAWTPVSMSMYGSAQSASTPLMVEGAVTLKSPYYLSTTSSWMNDSGTLQEAAINEPRARDGGILWEPTQTNHITNPRAEGGGATPPTTWVTTGVDATVTATWEGQFVHTDGLTYQRVRMVSAPNVTTNLAGRIQFVGTTSIPGTAASGILGQVRVMLTAGSVANATFALRIPGATVSTQAFVPTATSQLVSMFYTFGADAGQTLQIQCSATAGTPIDFTLAIATPSATTGDMLASVPLPPIGSPVSFTRAATKTIATLGSSFNKRTGTIIVEAKVAQQSAALQGILALDNNSFNYRLYCGILPNTATATVTAFDGGAQSLFNAIGTVPINTPFRIALAYTTTGVRASVNGGAVVSVAGTVPVAALTRITLGDLGIGVSTMNGVIYSAVYYETAMGDDMLRQATA